MPKKIIRTSEPTLQGIFPTNQYIQNNINMINDLDQRSPQRNPQSNPNLNRSLVGIYGFELSLMNNHHERNNRYIDETNNIARNEYQNPRDLFDTNAFDNDNPLWDPNFGVPLSCFK